MNAILKFVFMCSIASNVSVYTIPVNQIPSENLSSSDWVSKKDIRQAFEEQKQMYKGMEAYQNLELASTLVTTIIDKQSTADALGYSIFKSTDPQTWPKKFLAILAVPLVAIAFIAGRASKS